MVLVWPVESLIQPWDRTDTLGGGVGTNLLIPGGRRGCRGMQKQTPSQGDEMSSSQGSLIVPICVFLINSRQENDMGPVSSVGRLPGG